MINRKSLRAIKPIYLSYNVYKYLVFQLKLSIASLRDWNDRQNLAYSCSLHTKAGFIRMGLCF